jgi:transposase
VVSLYKFNQIKKLQQQGLNISEIANELGLDWKTAQKYANANGPPILRPRTHRTRKNPLESFESAISELIKIPKINTWDIYNELKNRNYAGSYATVNRYLKIHSDKKPKERYFEQTYEPGNEVQVDFKEDVTVKIMSTEVVVNLFFGSLPFSEKVFIKSYPGLNFECFADGLVSCFEYFGGIPLKVRQDNLKPCVASLLKGRNRKYTEKYQKLISYYDFEVSPCNPARGNEKGHVERDIQTFSRRIKSRLLIEKKEFADFDELNQWLLNTVEIMQTEILNKFLEEKIKFRSLRTRFNDVVTQTILATTSKYGTVRFGKSVYSVPDGYIDLNVKLVVSAYEIKLFDINNGKLITTHKRLKDNSSSILLEHVIGSLIRKPQAMLSWRHRDIFFADEELNRFYKALKKQDSYNAEKKFLQVLNLIQHKNLDEIKAGISLWIENTNESPLEFIKNLIIEQRRPSEILQTKIEPNLEHYNQYLN